MIQLMIELQILLNILNSKTLIRILELDLVELFHILSIKISVLHLSIVTNSDLSLSILFFFLCLFHLIVFYFLLLLLLIQEHLFYLLNPKQVTLCNIKNILQYLIHINHLMEQPTIKLKECTKHDEKLSLVEAQLFMAILCTLLHR